MIFFVVMHQILEVMMEKTYGAISSFSYVVGFVNQIVHLVDIDSHETPKMPHFQAVLNSYALQSFLVMYQKWLLWQMQMTQ